LSPARFDYDFAARHYQEVTDRIRRPGPQDARRRWRSRASRWVREGTGKSGRYPPDPGSPMDR